MFEKYSYNIIKTHGNVVQVHFENKETQEGFTIDITADDLAYLHWLVEQFLFHRGKVDIQSEEFK